MKKYIFLTSLLTALLCMSAVSADSDFNDIRDTAENPDNLILDNNDSDDFVGGETGINAQSRETVEDSFEYYARNVYHTNEINADDLNDENIYDLNIFSYPDSDSVNENTNILGVADQYSEGMYDVNIYSDPGFTSADTDDIFNINRFTEGTLTNNRTGRSLNFIADENYEQNIYYRGNTQNNPGTGLFRSDTINFGDTAVNNGTGELPGDIILNNPDMQITGETHPDITPINAEINPISEQLPAGALNVPEILLSGERSLPDTETASSMSRLEAVDGILSVIVEVVKPVAVESQETPEDVDIFTDLTDASDSEVLQYAKRIGLVAGYPDGTFNPGKNISREEFAALTFRSFDIISKYNFAIKYSVDELNELQDFLDNHAVGAFANPALRVNIVNGIIEPVSKNTLEPHSDADTTDFLRYKTFVLNNAKLKVA